MRPDNKEKYRGCVAEKVGIYPFDIFTFIINILSFIEFVFSQQILYHFVHRRNHPFEDAARLEKHLSRSSGRSWERSKPVPKLFLEQRDAGAVRGSLCPRRQVAG